MAGAKLQRAVNADGSHNCWLFQCPGCATDPLNTGLHFFDNRWTFNGDVNRPTFAPSLMVRWEEGEEKTPRVCHSFVRDGRIEYLGDCTHPLAGKTVEIPDWDEAAF